MSVSVTRLVNVVSWWRLMISFSFVQRSVVFAGGGFRWHRIVRTRIIIAYIIGGGGLVRSGVTSHSFIVAQR
ncbi:hypothetical protein ACXZ9C_10690 [Streptococcus agalactiae]